MMKQQMPVRNTALPPQPGNAGLNKKKGKIAVWMVTVILSAVFLCAGHVAVTGDLAIFTAPTSSEKARVLELQDLKEDQIEGKQTKTLSFRAIILSGAAKGREVQATQEFNTMYAGTMVSKQVQAGSLVMLLETPSPDGGETIWRFEGYYRLHIILILLAIFAALVLALGRWQGVNTLLSLFFTFSFVFYVFIPAVMQGLNIYLFAFLTVLYVIVMTLFLIHGWSAKTLATMLGCIGGVLTAILALLILNQFLSLTGVIDEHSFYLLKLHPERPINLVAILFSSIIIGAMGAIMDVAMDIASSLYELTEHAPGIQRDRLLKSGLTIGRDIMGTMANTLVLAYIGSSLAGITILLTYSGSALQLLNRESIITEILQALIGSLAIVLTMPLTAVICSLLYVRPKRRQREPLPPWLSEDPYR